ncbi:MAG: glycoside hydrolase family 28 protein [Acholeplasmataceae bacterium]|nr:glycoside hydrolase family 28 protein [Acholeplasmataceae bacterium]
MFECVFISSGSLSFELTNKHAYHAPAPYDVYLDDKKVICGHTLNVFSLFGLKPGTTYEISVGEHKRTVQTDWVKATLDVRQFNTFGDGIHDDTAALQAAILACPKQGLIKIPKGTFLTGPLFLKSEITLDLDKDAIILGKTDRDAYPILPAQIHHRDGHLFELSSFEGVPAPTYASLFTGIGVHHIKIIGEGIIEENAHNSDWWVDHKTMRKAWRPKGMFFSHCSHIGLHGITVRNTPSWNIHPYFSTHIDLIDVKLQSPKDSPNTDGFNPESSSHIRVIGVDFSVGDDCIAIKSGKFDMGMVYRTPTSDMLVRNCHMAYGHGAVVLGSEMSGGVKNLTVTQCLFEHTDRGLRIKTRRGRGESGIIDGITFENIVMNHVLTPLVINMYYDCDHDGKTEYVWSREALPVDSRTPYLGTFTFKNMVCDNVHVAAGYFDGLPEQPIEKIRLENIVFSYALVPTSGKPAMMTHAEPMVGQGLIFKHVGAVELDRITINPPHGQPIVTEGVKHLTKQSDD